MQNSKPRSGHAEVLAQGSHSLPRSTQASSKSVKGLNFPIEPPDSKAAKMSDKKPTGKHSSLTEKQNSRGSEMQLHHLQEELRRARDERTKALEDLEELRSNRKLLAFSNKEEMEVLEKKVEKAKESEMKMLESLTSQTKQLEQTKILLEEAKLEIHSLQDKIKSLEESSFRNNLENGGRQRYPLDIIQAQEEIAMLRNELKLATQAEEKSKKAMDDLAIALKEVTTDASQVKAKLSNAQSEIEKAKLEAEQSKSLLKIVDEKLRSSVEESERLRMDAEHYATEWKEKESQIMNLMKVTEEESTKLKLENKKLIESLGESREETSKLRDILKQAVNEATGVKEALEIARKENSQLEELLSEKENSLQSIKQEYQRLKVSEATAVDSVKELKGFLAATPFMDTTSKPSKSSRHSLGVDEPSAEPKKQLFPSLSNVSDSVIPSSVYTEDRKSSAIDFNHISGVQSNRIDYLNGSPTRKKKRKNVLKRFGEMLSRRSFHK
ncbi:uncharacterized protein A4U43_C04F16090 [Asparagus officinalis]|uniref:WEB family protein n=1 Tax=Asparagus officinalis TaxID=4686 RepID=A0A5P1F1R4_ASPOF|nr:plectin-like [Asparagus officinalis]XP_020261214.1 plectin-like [Asparagus officinalis]XP_020261215.1 plectin-like [Asparagus officinalis]XP_020261216.1 plectin-like [Asparagus officinalis]XP_020261217.1 plectin-like [Asparagus officinalis]XP_020261218.1 plectin-like [Asparagus officinalis]ONK72132.1 uncharacterized protein A4U43_C04F16090 [Asparagus officinalis]